MTAANNAAIWYCLKKNYNSTQRKKIRARKCPDFLYLNTRLIAARAF